MKRMYWYNCKGTSLVELIVGMVIVSGALLSMFYLFMTLAVGNVAGQNRMAATTVAQELMEDIKTERFDERYTKDVAGNWSGTLGSDTGETSTDKSTFDDVDDFHGWSESLSSPYLGYARSVTVIYVAASNLDTSAASSNDYKKVTVTVTKDATTFATLSSVITPGRLQDL